VAARLPVADGPRVISRRRTSRNVALTAAFLALAAGGAAACDASATDEDDPFSSYVGGPAYSDSGSSGSEAGSWDGGGSDADTGGSDESGDEADASDDDQTDEVFYCADEDGEIVDADYCDDDGDRGSYFIWHSSTYARGLTVGSSLDGGDYFPAGDRKARRAYHLPATGKVSNGTVKTNLVGQRSSSSGSGSRSAGG